MTIPKLPSGDGPMLASALAFALLWRIADADVATLVIVLAFALAWRFLGTRRRAVV